MMRDPSNLLFWITGLVVLALCPTVAVSQGGRPDAINLLNVDMAEPSGSSQPGRPTLAPQSTAGREGSSPFGVCEHFRDWSADEIRRSTGLMKQAGIPWVRFDFAWDAIEREPGKFDYARYDEVVDLLRSQGVRILAILGYSVGWANGGKGDKYPPLKDADFANFVSQTVRRYKDRIGHWEIWNEENADNFFAPKANATRYTALLKAGYAAVKGSDPHAVVLVGGIASCKPSYLNDLYKNGAKDYFDVVSLHPYSGTVSASIGIIRNVRLMMESHGDSGKKIWITEMGWPTAPPASGVWESFKHAILRFVGVEVDEAGQASRLNSFFANALALQYVEKIFWYELKDGGQNPTDHEHHFGLLRYDFSPKPAYDEYGRVAKRR